MVNKPLIRPCTLGGGWLASHKITVYIVIPLHQTILSKPCNRQQDIFPPETIIPGGVGKTCDQGVVTESFQHVL